MESEGIDRIEMAGALPYGASPQSSASDEHVGEISAPSLGLFGSPLLAPADSTLTGHETPQTVPPVPPQGSASITEAQAIPRRAVKAQDTHSREISGRQSSVQ